MSHATVHGLDIAIENPRGSERLGIGKDGEPWSVKRMANHYGFIRNTEGADHEPVDCFVGPHIKSPRVYVIDQVDADTGDFDESKVMLGFASRPQVLKAYQAAFSDDRAHQRIGKMTEMSVPDLKDWLRKADTTKPFARAAGGRVGMASGGVANPFDVHDQPNGVDDWIVPAAAPKPSKAGRSNLPKGYVIDKPGFDASKPYKVLSDKDVGLGDDPRSWGAIPTGNPFDEFDDKPDDWGAFPLADNNPPPRGFKVDARKPPFDPKKPYKPVPDWALPDAPWVQYQQEAQHQARQKLAEGLKDGRRDDPARAAAWRSNIGVPPATAAEVAAQGATFGLSDEASAAFRAPIEMAIRGEGFGEAYEHNLAAERERLDQYRKDHPYVSTAAELVGGLAAPVSALKAASSTRTVLPAMKAGAIYGGLYGAGSSEGDLTQRAIDAGAGAGTGAAFGAGTASVLKLGKAVTAGVSAAIKPEARAVDALRRDLARDQVTAPQGLAELSAAQAEGKPMTIADLGGRNVVGLARAVTTGKGQGSQTLNATLEARRLDAPARIVDDLKVALADPDLFHSAVDTIAQRRQAIAAPLYQAAYGKPLPRNNVTIDNVLSTPAGAKAAKAAQELSENEGIAFNPQSVRGADLMKRAMDDMVETARRSGSMNEARIVANLRNKLVNAVDMLVPEYKAARQAWSSHTDLSEAIERGRQFLKPGLDPETAVKEIQAMSPGERQIARIGMAREIKGMFDQPQMTLSKINSLLNSDRMKAVTKELFPNQAAFDRFRGNLSREASMLRRGQQIQGGSNTANKLTETEDAGLGGAAVDALKGHYVRAAMSVAGGAGQRFARGVNEKVADRLGEMLSTADPPRQREILHAVASRLPPGGMTHLLAQIAARGGPQLGLQLKRQFTSGPR